MRLTLDIGDTQYVLDPDHAGEQSPFRDLTSAQRAVALILLDSLRNQLSEQAEDEEPAVLIDVDGSKWIKVGEDAYCPLEGGPRSRFYIETNYGPLREA